MQLPSSNSSVKVFKGHNPASRSIVCFSVVVVLFAASKQCQHALITGSTAATFVANCSTCMCTVITTINLSGHQTLCAKCVITWQICALLC